MPDALEKLLAAHLAAVEALFGEFALDDHLGGDAGVVSAGEPQGIVAAHAMPADDCIDLGVLEHVAHVERAGDVGGRDHERKYAAAGLGIGMENAAVDPPLGPMRLEPLRLVDLIDLHWNLYDTGSLGLMGRGWRRGEAILPNRAIPIFGHILPIYC